MPVRCAGTLAGFQTIQSRLSMVGRHSLPEALLLTVSKRAEPGRRQRLSHRRKRFLSPLLQALCLPAALRLPAVQNFAMPILRKTAQEKGTPGAKLKYFVRGDLGVSYTQFAALKMSGGVRQWRTGAGVFRRLARRAEVAPEDTRLSAPSRWNSVQSTSSMKTTIFTQHKLAPLPCQCSQRQENGTLENRLAARAFGEKLSFALSTA